MFMLINQEHIHTHTTTVGQPYEVSHIIELLCDKWLVAGMY